MTDDNELVIITEPKTISFDLTKKVNNSLKYETDHMKHNAFLAEHKIKNKTERLFFKYKHKNDIHEYEKNVV